MLNGLRDFTVKMVAGANVATVAFMLLVGYSDLLNPERFPAFCNAGLLFPVFLSLNLGFLIFWVVFRARYVLIPLLGFLVSFVPVRQYMPVNMKEMLRREASRFCRTIPGDSEIKRKMRME